MFQVYPFFPFAYFMTNKKAVERVLLAVLPCSYIVDVWTTVPVSARLSHKSFAVIWILFGALFRNKF